MNKIRSLLKIFKKKERFIYIDIDKPYFIKPTSHFIYYRRSASGKHFHLKFKRDWITKAELLNLFLQSDLVWLCKQVVQRQFRVARSKGEKVAEDWKRTEVVTPFFVLRSCGQITKYNKIGKKLYLGFSFNPSEISEGRFFPKKWVMEAIEELDKNYGLLSESFKERGSYYGMYNDFDYDGEDLYYEDEDDYEEDYDDMEDYEDEADYGYQDDCGD